MGIFLLFLGVFSMVYGDYGLGLLLFILGLWAEST